LWIASLARRSKNLNLIFVFDQREKTPHFYYLLSIIFYLISFYQ